MGRSYTTAFRINAPPRPPINNEYGMVLFLALLVIVVAAAVGIVFNNYNNNNNNNNNNKFNFVIIFIVIIIIIKTEFGDIIKQVSSLAPQHLWSGRFMNII